VVVGRPEPPRVVFLRAASHAMFPPEPATRRPADGPPPPTIDCGDVDPAARQVGLHAPVVPVGVPRPAAPAEGSVRLWVVDGTLGRLGGFTFRDVERAPPEFAAHYALADLFAYGAVAPVAQGRAHGVVAFGGGAEGRVPARVPRASPVRPETVPTGWRAGPRGESFRASRRRPCRGCGLLR